MARFAIGSRTDALTKLAETRFDLLVIGGGITGAGVALDAATRGLKVALIERNDFASGTSSKSTKLIHGGLRYLEQRDFGLTFEALRERDLLRRIAPHLVRPIPFLWPKWAGASAKAGLGLWIYDAMAGLKNVKRHERVKLQGAMELAPQTRKQSGGYIYYDSQTDDARLTMAVLRAAVRSGAVICNHIDAQQLIDVSGRVVGCVAYDQISGSTIEVRSGDVVNATGVWADELRVSEDPEANRNLRPSKGIHIVLPLKALPIHAAVLFPLGRRKLAFAIPWRSSVLVGTTDEEYSGPLGSPKVEADEVAYLLGAAQRAFDIDLSEKDLVGAFAGLRPLLADAAHELTRDLSRKHAIFRGPKGLITVTGGKLTTYRKMAEEVVDMVTRRQGRYLKCVTRSTRLGVTDLIALRTQAEAIAVDVDMSEDSIDHLIMSYGDDTLGLLEMARSMELGAPLCEGLPYIEAEAAWGVTQEMSVTASDLLERRTRLSLEDPSGGTTASQRISEIISGVGADAGSAFQSSLEAYADRVAAERGPVAPFDFESVRS